MRMVATTIGRQGITIVTDPPHHKRICIRLKQEPILEMFTIRIVQQREPLALHQLEGVSQDMPRISTEITMELAANNLATQ